MLINHAGKKEFMNSIPLNFNITGAPNACNDLSISKVGEGLINDTFLVHVSAEEQGSTAFIKSKKYILQRINHEVFQNIENLMANIKKVSDHLKSKFQCLQTRCLVIVCTNENKMFWQDESGDYWRMYNYIPNSTTFEVSPNDRYLYEAGRAYGQFQRYLSDLPSPGDLHETIVDFHNTPKRLKTFRKAVYDDKFKRAKNIRNDIAYIESIAHIANIIFDRLADGRLPKRVTHNDTKLGNVLFDAKTGNALCVIDYDTIMPNGCILHDFGDAIRSMANTAREDEQDLEKVTFNLVSFQQFTEGFLKESRMILTEIELEMLANGVLVITFEQVVRFFTDYLMGDIYFKIDHPNHNLDRARNQIKLLKDMIGKEKEIDHILQKIKKYEGTS